MNPKKAIIILILAALINSCATSQVRTITRGGIKYDAIEEDARYKEIIGKVEEEVEKNISESSLPEKGQDGYCHVLWREKKNILKNEYGIDWKSPAELNPEIIFD